jgi:hypothetical protein
VIPAALLNLAATVHPQDQILVHPAVAVIHATVVVIALLVHHLIPHVEFQKSTT